MTDGNGASAASATPEPWTILRLLQWTTEHLRKTGSTSPRLDAEVLLAEARQCQRIELYTAFAEEASEEIKARFRELVKRRAAGEPVAYLVGKKEFYSLNFHVTKDCLIPRGETEHLVIECLDRAKEFCKEDPSRTIDIADVCTGSGCVAVSIAKNIKNANVIAIDISPAALAIAKKNIESHDLSDRVTPTEGNLLASIEDGSLDFVVSNPPYVSESEYETLHKSVRNHEPKLALVSGSKGTELIAPLAEQAVNKLRPNGWFLCEFSPMIADDVASMLEQSGYWEHINIVKDLAGHKRLIVAQKKDPPM